MNTSTRNITKWTIVSIIAFILIVALFVGGCAGVKSFNRAQKRADAKNQTAIVHQQIKTAQQQAQVNNAQIEATKAEANKRFWEATGIRRAQDEISKTLTPLYVQHEAIQKLPEARAIYVPAGANGIPQVYDVGASTKSQP